jgi:hypothetical protein
MSQKPAMIRCLSKQSPELSPTITRAPGIFFSGKGTNMIMKGLSKVWKFLKGYLSILQPLGKIIIHMIESIVISWTVASLGVVPTLIIGASFLVVQSYIINQASDIISNLAHFMHKFHEKARRWIRRLQFKIAFYLFFFVLAAQLMLGSAEEEEGLI